MKVKIFESTVSADDLENKIDEWAGPLKPEIQEVKVTITPMFQYVLGTSIVDDSWSHYLATITYKTE